jgi:hypothetical protein
MPNDHLDTFRTAVALIRHIRRRDEDAVAALLADAIPDPDAAGRLIMGLSGLVSSLLDALPKAAGDALLDATALDLARAEGDTAGA